jgi:hypothetical protein
MYATNAQKQAAYRARNRGKQPPLEREILWAARRLDGAVGIAAMEGNEFALKVRGANAVITLRNLATHFEFHDADTAPQNDSVSISVVEKAGKRPRTTKLKMEA